MSFLDFHILISKSSYTEEIKCAHNQECESKSSHS